MRPQVASLLKIFVVGVVIGLGFAIGSAVAGAREGDSASRTSNTSSELGDEAFGDEALGPPATDATESCAGADHTPTATGTADIDPAPLTGTEAPVAESADTSLPEKEAAQDETAVEGAAGADPSTAELDPAEDAADVEPEPTVDTTEVEEPTPIQPAEPEASESHEVTYESIMFTTVFSDDLKLKFKQDAEAETGDAISASQVIGVSAAGDANADAANAVGGDGEAAADSGTASASNAMDVNGPLVGGHVTVNATTITGPITYQIIIKDDLKITFKQIAGADSGDALAGSQVVGMAAGGSGIVDASNSGGAASKLLASSGFATALNSLLFSDVLVGGDLIVNAMTVHGAITWSLLVGDDIDVKIKQLALSNTGDALAGGQSIGVNAGGTAQVSASNDVAGQARATSGRSSSTNDVSNPPAPTGGAIAASTTSPLQTTGLAVFAGAALAVASMIRRRAPLPRR